MIPPILIRRLCCAGFLVFSLLQAGCALGPSPAIAPTTVHRIAPRAEITTTPFIEQAEFQCAPASLAMVLNHYGTQVNVDTLASQVFSPKAEGSFPAELDVASRRQGFISYPVSTLENLLLELDSGHPVLVFQNLGVSWNPRWHFAVAVGYDLEQNELILRSGDNPRRQTSFHVFDNTWQRSQRWARVILPPHQVPTTAEPLPFMKVAVKLEQNGQNDAAMQAYRAAVERWPEQALPRFALANLLLAEGQTAKASNAFYQLLQQHPHHAEGWNNMAYSLLYLGCHQKARQAAQCAVSLAPDNPLLGSTLNQMLTLPTVHEGGCPPVPTCPPPATPIPD